MLGPLKLFNFILSQKSLVFTILSAEYQLDEIAVQVGLIRNYNSTSYMLGVVNGKGKGWMENTFSTVLMKEGNCQ